MEQFHINFFGNNKEGILMKDKICSIVITYNRPNLLIKNLDMMLKQTIKSDILVFDNHSSDETKKILKDKGYLNNEQIQYYYNDENIGGAGGFEKAMRVAFSNNYDFIYLMDDDGRPIENTTLEKLVSKYKSLNNKLLILNSLVVYNRNLDVTFNCFKVKNYRDKIKDDLLDNIMPFNGTLISKEVIKKIGFPRGDFFIRGDEREYTLRARKNHVMLLTYVKSLYYHPVPKKSYKRFLWKKVEFEEEAPWKKYYETRNSIYILKKYYSKRELNTFELKLLIKTIMWDKRNIITIKKAITDGKNEDFTYKAHIYLKE